MMRVAAALVAIPLLLAALLTAAATMQEGALGSVTVETFELGLAPIVLFVALVLLLVYVPLLFMVSKFARLTVWNSTLVGLVSAVLPLFVSAWPTLSDSTLRLGFRLEQFFVHFPWLAMGAAGGFLFWLLALYRNGEFGSGVRNTVKDTHRAGAA